MAITGVLTISDRASTGVYKDIGGPAILSNIAQVLESEWEAVYRVVPDEQPHIEAAIIEMVRLINSLISTAYPRN